MDKYDHILLKYLPESSVAPVKELLQKHRIHLRITRSRTSKTGDYRPPSGKQWHRISVNHELNRFHFLITLLHETAHLITWEKFGRKAKPHGKEWKKEFSMLLQDFADPSVFPEDILAVLKKTMANPRYSTSADNELQKALRKYDKVQHALLDDLPLNSLFRIYNGIVFKKMEKKRTRYRCLRMDNHQTYSVSGHIPVFPVKDPDPLFPGSE